VVSIPGASNALHPATKKLHAIIFPVSQYSYLPVYLTLSVTVSMITFETGKAYR